MAKRPRLTFEGAIHHITFRGSGRQAIFHRAADRNRFLESLEERCRQKGSRLDIRHLEVVGGERGG